MAEMRCPKCNKTIGAAEEAAFCPFCGAKLPRDGLDFSAVFNEPDPVKKHEKLLALRQQHPDNPDVAEELLHLGRLYERGRKGVDFSIIKCYVLNVYLEPDALRKSMREALRHEIFHHPDLDNTLALSGDRTIAMRRYLTRLSEDFVRLFLKGSSRHMHSLFGYVNTSKAPKHLALPAARMLSAMRRDETLDEEQRKLLMQSFYAAFSSQMNGETQYLDELLSKYNIPIEPQ